MNDSQAGLGALAAALPPTAYLGTSTWTYPGWNGLVYHRAKWGKPKAAELLKEYATFPLFRTVGIDAAFYGPPSPERLEGYAEALPAGFPCVSKVWDAITAHTFGREHRLRPGEENPDFLNADKFATAMLDPYRQHFSNHTGPFVFQFSPVPKRARIKPGDFAERLDRFFSALPREAEYAVELRNGEYLVPAYFEVLRRHGVAHVFNAVTHMPTIGEQLDLPGSMTASFMVCRALLRPGRTYEGAVAKFEPFDEIREPLPEVRADLTRLIGLAATGGGRTYILVNNRLEGSAPRTIMAVAEQWANRGRPAL